MAPEAYIFGGTQSRWRGARWKQLYVAHSVLS